MARFAAVGAGRMGRGIAIAFAYAGHRIALIDLKPRAPQAWQALRDEAHAEIRSSLQGLAMLGAFDAQRVDSISERVQLVDARGAAEALRDAELVFEGVPETMAAKRDAFEQLNGLCSDHAILTSTTSSILVTQLAALVPGCVLSSTTGMTYAGLSQCMFRKRSGRRTSSASCVTRMLLVVDVRMASSRQCRLSCSNASRCARRSATARRTTRWPITTSATAGCTAMRTSSS